MTHDPESKDFVIKRRRRRGQITVFSSSSPSQEHKSSEEVSERTYNTRSRTRARESTEQNPVTVEDFLRRSSPISEKKKRRYADLNNPEQSHGAGPSKRAPKRKAGSSSDDEWLPHVATSTDAISSSSPLPRKKFGTLSERMLRAAALSHVRLDPAENLTHIANPERPALHFEAVPSSTLESRLQLSVKKKWRLIDPRKAFNVRSEFISKPSSTSTSAPTGSRKSVGHWRPPDTVRSLATQSTPAPKRERKRPRESQVGHSSLTFVPIKPCSDMPDPSMQSYHGRTENGLTQRLPSIDVVPPDIEDQQVLVYDSDTPQIPPPKECASSSSRHLNDIPNPSDADDALPTNLSTLSRAPTLTQKPLKPFDSFLDGLMETARHATAVEKSKSRSRSFRMKPSTSIESSMMPSCLRRKHTSRFPIMSTRPVTKPSLNKRKRE